MTRKFAFSALLGMAAVTFAAFGVFRAQSAPGAQGKSVGKDVLGKDALAKDALDKTALDKNALQKDDLGGDLLF